MDSLTLLREARRVGLEVDEAAGRLVIRGPRRFEPLARALLGRKAAILAALSAEHKAALEWRVAAMRAMAPAHGPMPLLLARPGALGGPGRCCSCGEALSPADRYRCRPCVEAVVQVLETLP